MSNKIIAQGAEAKITLSDNIIIKDRISKSYRLKEIDEKIRKQRTKSEKKLLEKACKIINAPNPFPLEEFDKIKMPFIEGEKLSQMLDSLPLKKQKEICKIVGEEISKLHNADIIHGDLTTSNMIYVYDKVYFIDFGLGFISHKIEDKAVDLHLLRQALEAKHFKHWKELFDEVLRGYSASKNSDSVLKQFRKVEARGRYKESY